MSSHSWTIDARRLCGSTTSSPARTCSIVSTRSSREIWADSTASAPLDIRATQTMPVGAEVSTMQRAGQVATRSRARRRSPGPSTSSSRSTRSSGRTSERAHGDPLVGQPQAQRRQVPPVQGGLHGLPQQGEPGSHVDGGAPAMDGAPGRGVGVRHVSSSRHRLRRRAVAAHRRGVLHTVVGPGVRHLGSSGIWLELGTPHLSSPYHNWGRGSENFPVRQRVAALACVTQHMCSSNVIRGPGG